MTAYDDGKRHGANAARMHREGKLVNTDEVLDYHKRIEARDYSNASREDREQFFAGFSGGFARASQAYDLNKESDPALNHRTQTEKNISHSDNRGMFARALDKVKEFSFFKPEPVTLARNISTNDRVALPDRERAVKENSRIEKKNDSYTLPKGAHLATANTLSHRDLERHQMRYMRPQQEIANEKANVEKQHTKDNKETAHKMEKSQVMTL